MRYIDFYMHYAVTLQNEVIKYNIYSVFVRISLGYLNSGDYLKAAKSTL